MEEKGQTDVRRIGGQLHLVHSETDERGNQVTNVVGPLKVEFRLTDFGQLFAGACVMALPVALTGEVWDLGETLSISHTLAILFISVAALALFNWALFYGGHISKYRRHFVNRTLSAYIVTFALSFMLLWLFDQAPLDNLRVALTRTVLVAFPACFAATAVDYMK